jgi:indole-3-glycerol phosphate synthase
MPVAASWGADAVLLALVFVDDQKSHSFFDLLFSFLGQDNRLYGIERKR